MSKTLRAVLLTFFLLPGCNCDPQLVSNLRGDLQGLVCSADGAPLVGAAITLTGTRERETVTNGNGEYRFNSVPVGRADITATLGDVVREFPDNEVFANELTVITDTACRDQPAPPVFDSGVLDGHICNRHTGELVSDAEVLIPLADGTVLTGATDGEGRFSVAVIPTGDHVVTIRGEGYQRSFAVAIVKDQTTSLDLAEDCESVNLGEGGIIGKFCDPASGGNLISAAVTVKPVLAGPTEEEQHDITDIEGEFEINGLLPGNYDVEVRADGYLFDMSAVQVIAGELTSITDVASCGGLVQVGRIEGQLCDADAGGTFVGTIELQQGGVVIDATQTAADGRFTFNGVVPGTYQLRAFRENFERSFAGVVVEAFRATLIEEGECPAQFDLCTVFENEPSLGAEGRIVLVVDKSGSMGESFAGGEKWAATRSSLINVTASLTSTVEFGLVLFPEPGGEICAEGSTLRVGLAHDNAAQIATALEVTPSGGTPTAPTLANVKEFVTSLLLADGRSISVVLATDGGPNCNEELVNPSCTCTTPDLPPGSCPANQCLDNVNAYNEVTAMKNLGVSTFVVGITGVESFSAVLDEMAVRGGTARQVSAGAPKYYPADDATALESALELIARRVTVCRVTTTTNLTTVNNIEVSVGGTVIAQDNARQNGWDLMSSTVIQLFGSACDVAVASLDNVLITTCVSP